MNDKIFQLNVIIPKKYSMSIKEFYDRCVEEYKKDYPICFNETDFYDYVDSNIDVLIRDIFKLSDNEEIPEVEVDYVFDLFNEYFDALFSK